MFIGDIKPKKKEQYNKLEGFIRSYIEKKYPPFVHYATNRSNTTFGDSWYIFFTNNKAGSKNNEFVVRLSDHPVGTSRASSSRHIYIDKSMSNERMKEVIDDYINPGKEVLGYKKVKDIREGQTPEIAYTTDNPKILEKVKVIEKCFRKNKRGKCINKYEFERKQPFVVSIKRPKWKG